MIPFLKRLVVSVDYLLSNSQWVPCTERLCECQQLIDYAAERPHVSFLSVGLRLNYLWARIQNSADEGLHYTRTLGAPFLCKAEICEFDVEITIYQYVRRCQISVHYSLLAM